MPQSRIHVTKTIIDTLFMRKALATQLYFTLHITPLPAGEGQGGGAFGAYIQKKRTTRITRTGLSKNNVNQCPILSNKNKI